MPHEVKGVVARAQGAPVTLETIVVPDPGPGEARRRGAGVRRLPHRPALPRGRHQRRLPVPARARGGRRRRGGRRGRHRRAPRRLRHPQLAGGLRPVPRLPARASRWYCFATHNATQKMTLTDGTALSPALGIGAFAEKTLVAAGQCTKVDPAAPPRPPGLLGCGVMAGLGAAINTGGVGRGDTRRRVRLRRRRRRRDRRVRARRRAHDHRRRHRRPEARVGAGASAPRTRSTRKDDDPVEAIKELTGGFGADVASRPSATPRCFEQAFDARDLAGTRGPGRRPDTRR